MSKNEVVKHILQQIRNAQSPMPTPCTACGGRGPHNGPGHSYTTERK